MTRQHYLQLLLVLCATIGKSTALLAQTTPQYELFVGGSYERVHAGGSELTQLLGISDIQYQPHNFNLNLAGWEGTLIENVNHWVGGEVDASGFYGSPGASFLYPATELVSPSPNFNQTVPVTTQEYNVLFGPRFSLRRGGRVVFFLHVPVGIAHISTNLNEQAVIASNFKVLPVGTLKASTGLAISPGVGVDVRVNSLMMIRLFQLDYLMTHVYGARQDNARLSAGVNFTFGEK